MDNELEAARSHFIQGVSRITHFWGFPKAMGAIYGAIYLSPEPISLDELVKTVGVTKGSVSTNVRQLERLGMVYKQVRVGDRKDYYVAEVDFWKVARGILREREKQEFDRALRTIGESLSMVQTATEAANESDLASFYKQRMENMKQFFDRLDNLVAMFIALEELRLGTVQRLFNKDDD